MNKILKDTIKGFVWGIIICLLIWLCTSCTTTRYINIPEYHEVIKIRTDSVLSHDSIYLHDSIFSFVHGDTVFVHKTQTKYLEKLKYINHTDTVCKNDSIRVPYPVEKQLTFTQRFRMNVLPWLLGILAAFLGLYCLIMKK